MFGEFTLLKFLFQFISSVYCIVITYLDNSFVSICVSKENIHLKSCISTLKRITMKTFAVFVMLFCLAVGEFFILCLKLTLVIKNSAFCLSLCYYCLILFTIILELCCTIFGVSFPKRIEAIMLFELPI